MFLAILVLLVALSLSGIAAYYSIIGLAAIFAAAVIPIIIMGGILEVAKLTVTVWLHQHWGRARWVMKLYLVPAVAVLMFITSMGIFGFLSKSHIEQTSANTESLVQVERIVSEISEPKLALLAVNKKLPKQKQAQAITMQAYSNRLTQSNSVLIKHTSVSSLLLQNRMQLLKMHESLTLQKLNLILSS